MGDKRLFLRWALINVLTVVLITAAGLSFASKIHGASLIAIPIILIVGGLASGYGGLICWRSDSISSTPGSAARAAIGTRLMHEAQYLIFSAWTCQMIGILSTIAGFWIILSGSNSATTDFQTRIQSGAAVALLGSFMGVLASLVLTLIHRMLEHELEG